MKRMNCRRIRREIEETVPGALLSLAVTDHLKNCVACATFRADQAKLQELVSSLGTIQAPGDFDFRLRARLANENRPAPQGFTMANFSFGVRSTAIAAVLLLIGAGIGFVSFKSSSDQSLSASRKPPAANAPAVNVTQAGAVEPKDVSPVVSGIGSRPDANQPNVEATLKPLDQDGSKRRGLRQTELASLRDRSRVKTKDLSSRPATVLRPSDLTAGMLEKSFPIGASYQSLKVSLDDGRGFSRTISLPTVSFGSQRVLAQGASPLLASDRGSW
jgi:hypothetical protein